MALRYVVHEDQITPEIRTKVQALARILAEQRPTPGQVHALLRLAAKDTGFLRRAYDVMMRRLTNE